MPGGLPNERLLPTHFKPVSINLHTSADPPLQYGCRHRQLAPPDRDSLPTLPIYRHGCMVLGHLSRPTGRRWPPSLPSVRTKKVHPTLAPNNLQAAAPLAKGGVPRLRSVHAERVCPTTDPPNGVCTVVVAASCSSVCIQVVAFDFEFLNFIDQKRDRYNHRVSIQVPACQQVRTLHWWRAERRRSDSHLLRLLLLALIPPSGCLTLCLRLSQSFWLCLL